MEVTSATTLVNTMVYKPRWKIEATDHCHRFENSIKVHIEYPAHSFNREDASSGYKRAITGGAEFIVPVGDCDDDCDLYRRVLDKIMTIEWHEAREALRIRPTFWAPFHPHRADGMKRFGDPEGDLHFGVV